MGIIIVSMKKLLALILIFPVFICAEDIEYPIELTCESGPWIHHISITGTSDGWIQQISGPMKNIHVPSLDYGEKYFFKNNIVITDSMIEIRMRFGLAAWVDHKINRLSGGYQVGDLSSGMRGKCFKGFKEYNKKQI